MKAERAVLLFRDIGSIMVGLGGIVWQLKTGPDPVVMGVLAAIASIPLANVGALRPTGAAATPGSSSLSPPPSGPGESPEPSSLPTSST